MSASLRQRVDAFLRAHHVMTLGTQDEAGPWAAAVFYAHEGLELVFLSSPRSRHATQLARDPRAAVTIQRDVCDWREISGIQAEGVVTEIEGLARERARRLYADKFALADGGAGTPPEIAAALERVRWYRFTPRRMFLLDNGLGFAHRDEIDCAAAG